MLNHSRPGRGSYLIVAVTVALSLTGCVTINRVADTKTGSSPAVTSAAKQVPTAKVLYDKMRNNVAAAKSVRIKGEVITGGKTQTIDLAGDRAGTNTRALVNDGTGQAELLTVGDSVYIKADTAYWTEHASATAAAVAAGKYVKVPAAMVGTDALKVGSLLDGAFTDLPLAGLLQKVEATNLDGTPAYVLADRLNPQAGRIYISADGNARLLRIVSTKSNAGTLDFSEWDAVPPSSAPPADQLVTIPGLG
jgi:hypothetical protein